jgi:two-component system chemotaxis response regulator CheY
MNSGGKSPASGVVGMVRAEFAALGIMLLSEKNHTAQTLRSVLTLAGITRITGIDNSRRALDILTIDNYDAIFCDDESETVDGLTFPLAARCMPGILNPMIPIFVFHERAKRRSVEAARDTGATYFLTCPISPKTVMTKLESALVNPRPFIKAAEYFGPDRRGRQRPVWSGKERRVRVPKKITVTKGSAVPSDPVQL